MVVFCLLSVVVVVVVLINGQSLSPPHWLLPPIRDKHKLHQSAAATAACDKSLSDTLMPSNCLSVESPPTLPVCSSDMDPPPTPRPPCPGPAALQWTPATSPSCSVCVRVPSGEHQKRRCSAHHNTTTTHDSLFLFSVLSLFTDSMSFVGFYLNLEGDFTVRPGCTCSSKLYSGKQASSCRINTKAFSYHPMKLILMSYFCLFNHVFCLKLQLKG